MAQLINDIKQEIAKEYISNETIKAVYGLTDDAIFDDEFSIVSIENILFNVIAFAIWTLQVLIDTHKKELQEDLLNQKSGRLAWYRTMALAFQYGFDLIPDWDQFINGLATPEQIENSKIVKYSAVGEGSEESRVILKIAGENAGVLTPITTPQFDAFKAYINEIKYAGVDITIINYEPDKLYLNLQIIRDPLLIDANGLSILYGNKPVEDAIKLFMKNLPFNGEFAIEYLEKYLMDNVEGVKIAHIVSAESSWIDAQTNDYGLPQPINIRAIPVSGYYAVQNFENVSYVV